MSAEYIIGQTDSPVGKIYRISAKWSRSDRLSTIKVRWSVGRMNYSVKPGLYAIGNPGQESDVFVSCNFKLSFDHLRTSLSGIDAWVLVIDTKGINVWCAAGKGTFGTAELSRRIKMHELEKLVNHRRVIVPQLGATGVSAHEVREKTGFRVMYGPVRTEDIKMFISSGYKATPEMRKVKFGLWERLKLVPVELTYGKYYLLLVPALFFILSGLNISGYSVDKAWADGGRSVINLFTSYLAGCVLTPAFLPYIPFRRFSLKGLFWGWATASGLLYLGIYGNKVTEIISWFMISGAISSFLAMNFTGSSTYTSLSGVQKEMKLALPLQIIFAVAGTLLWIISNFI